MAAKAGCRLVSVLAEQAPDIRLQSVQIITRLLKDGASLGELLPLAQEKLSARDAAHLQELVFGVTRWSGRLDCELGMLLKKPLRHKDTDVKVILWLALYEIPVSYTHLTLPTTPYV